MSEERCNNCFWLKDEDDGSICKKIGFRIMKSSVLRCPHYTDREYREILFRGISIMPENRGEFVYGSLLQGKFFENSDEFVTLIINREDNNLHIYSVEPYSVSQWSGSYDKNKNRIFEHDIIHISNLTEYGIDEISLSMQKGFSVVFSDGDFLVKPNSESCIQDKFRDHSWELSKFYSYDVEVVGDVFNSPELLDKCFV